MAERPADHNRTDCPCWRCNQPTRYLGYYEYDDVQTMPRYDEVTGEYDPRDEPMVVVTHLFECVPCRHRMLTDAVGLGLDSFDNETDAPANHTDRGYWLGIGRIEAQLEDAEDV